jgi:hypothetical protein
LKHSTNRSAGAYADVITVLNLAVEKPGLRYRLKSYGQAINFKQRCYRYMKILRDQQEEISGFVPGFVPETIYDKLIIRQVNETGDNDPKGRLISFETRDISGDLIDPETGEAISVEGITPTVGEPE